MQLPLHFCIIATLGILNVHVPVLESSVTLAQSDRSVEVRSETPSNANRMQNPAPAEDSARPLPEAASENAHARSQQNIPEKPKNIRLQNEELKACQNRERPINAIMARMSDRSAKQLELFTTISERTQRYYEESNLSVDNYETLLNQVETHKLLAEDAVAATHSASFGFECENLNPEDVTTTFKQHVQTQNTLLQNYRTAIKNMIVAIQTAHDSSEGVRDE